MEPECDKITLSIQALSTAERSLTMSAKREDIKTMFFGQERANTKILLINTVTQLPAGSGIRPMPEWQSRTCNTWWDTRMQMWHGMSIPMLPMPMQKILQFQTNGKAQKLGWGYTKFTPIGRRTIKRCNGSYTNEILKGETFWFIKRYNRKKTMVIFWHDESAFYLPRQYPKKPRKSLLYQWFSSLKRRLLHHDYTICGRALMWQSQITHSE